MRVEDDEDLIQDMPDADAEGSGQDAAAVETATESAASSPAQGETEATTLSLVRDVVDGKTAAAAASPAEGQEAGQQPGDQQTKTDPAADDYADVPFNKHPRFQQVLKERREFQADATRYRNVDSFLRSNNVTAEEAADVLTLAAMSKVDPRGAYERLKPVMLDIMTRAGVILPADLQQGVEKGVYTPQAAQEVSQLRAQQQSFVQQQQLREQQAQQRQQQEQAQSITSAATSWEADRKAKDPNFEAKLPSIMREVAFLHATEGKPTTPQGVTEQLAKAYSAVNAKFVPPAPPRPARPATRPVMGGQVNGSAKPASMSTLDIIRARAG